MYFLTRYESTGKKDYFIEKFLKKNIFSCAIVPIPFTKCKHHINLTLSSTKPPLLFLFKNKTQIILSTKKTFENTQKYFTIKMLKVTIYEAIYEECIFIKKVTFIPKS